MWQKNVRSTPGPVIHTHLLVGLGDIIPCDYCLKPSCDYCLSLLVVINLQTDVYSISNPYLSNIKLL